MHSAFHPISRLGLISLAMALAPSAGHSQEVRLSGASTTVSAVIAPHQNAVEKTTSIKLKVESSNTGKGLADLINKKCDASLTSEPLDIAVMAAKAAGTLVDPALLQLHEITTAEIVFIVHPSNPVATLTHQQIKDIHLGKITHWKAVGGQDKPITVYTDAISGGTRAMIKKVVLGGLDYDQNCKPLESVKLVNQKVANDPGGFGGLGLGFADPKVVKIIRTDKIHRPLGMITLGNPTPEVQKVIKAFKAAAALSARQH